MCITHLIVGARVYDDHATLLQDSRGFSQGLADDWVAAVEFGRVFKMVQDLAMEPRLQYQHVMLESCSTYISI